MFSLIRSCKVEGLSRNWQDIHHEQGGKLFRLQTKENWMWYSKIWLDRKLKVFPPLFMSLTLGTYWQVECSEAKCIQSILQLSNIIILSVYPVLLVWGHLRKALLDQTEHLFSPVLSFQQWPVISFWDTKSSFPQFFVSSTWYCGLLLCEQSSV